MENSDGDGPTDAATSETPTRALCLPFGYLPPVAYVALTLGMLAWHTNMGSKLDINSSPDILDWAADQHRVGIMVFGVCSLATAAAHAGSIVWWTKEPFVWLLFPVALGAIGVAAIAHASVAMAAQRDRPVTYTAQGCNHVVVPVKGDEDPEAVKKARDGRVIWNGIGAAGLALALTLLGLHVYMIRFSKDRRMPVRRGLDGAPRLRCRGSIGSPGPVS